MKEFESLEYPVIKQQIALNCCFSLGKEYIVNATPSYDFLWVRRELARTKEALATTIRYGSMPLLGLFDVHDSVKDAKRDITLRAFELRRIAQQSHAIKAISTYHKGCEIETPYLDEIVDSFENTIKLSTVIESCISANDEVLDRASSELASLRKSIRLCEGDISSEVQRFISHHGSALMDTITTTRNDRICVLMKVSEKNSVRGFVHGESASGQTAYVEPESLLLLNNRLQSLRSKEKEEIERILFVCSQEVKQYANQVLANLDTFALLDMTFAKAIWAKNNHGCVAKVEENGAHIHFRNARHPLLNDRDVVANTYEIKAPFRSLLITGSNTGGKTVTLKTIGLFACMTQSGMPICADDAIMPFFTQIFVDIGDDQSIQESLSTFSAHVSKLAYICEHVSTSSLVLLDELGSGTDPKEGESLAVAILDELRQQSAFVIATTHYSALKNYAIQSDDILISSVEFDVEKMCPTYRYKEGVSGQSNALAIASRYHMKASVLRKAQEIKDSQATKQDELIEKLDKEIATYQQKKEQMEQSLLDIKQLQQALQDEKERMAKEKERILDTVREQHIEKLENTQKQAYAIIEELRGLSHDVKPHIITKLKHDLDALSKEEVHIEKEKQIVFHVGDYVCLDKLNYYGEILEINKEKVCIFANGMRMNTRISELSLAQRPKKVKKDKGYSKHLRNASFSMELNLIGMNVQEAVSVIDKYLDDAILANVTNVRLIHGMGTGALRKGIHAYLKKHPRVEEFRMGGQGEGGLGATVVSLKSKVKKHG